MTKEELRVTADLFDILDKEKMKEILTKDDFIMLCECLKEEADKWKLYMEDARRELDLLLNIKKASDTFQHIFNDLV